MLDCPPLGLLQHAVKESLDPYPDEVRKFVDYWKEIKGNVNETLVFDCKFTTYNILDGLERDGVKFITLRKRYAGLIRETLEFPKDE